MDTEEIKDVVKLSTVELSVVLDDYNTIYIKCKNTGKTKKNSKLKQFISVTVFTYTIPINLNKKVLLM